MSRDLARELSLLLRIGWADRHAELRGESFEGPETVFEDLALANLIKLTLVKRIHGVREPLGHTERYSATDEGVRVYETVVQAYRNETKSD